jgi:hypothetical protein
MKQCRSCGVEKPLSEYHIRRDNGKHRNDCIECQRDKKNEKQYKELYGISLSDYDKLFEAQGGTCAFCHLPQHDPRKNRLCVDHDHETGEVRGLLCSNCNVGLGLFKDDERILINAIRYLRSFKERL